MKKLIVFIMAIVLALTLILVGCNTNSLTENEALALALEHCKTNYDDISVTYNEDREVWLVGFWEDNAKIAAQTITIDKEGEVVSISWAE